MPEPQVACIPMRLLFPALATVVLGVCVAAASAAPPSLSLSLRRVFGGVAW
jgi:hypothetical protein